MPPTNSLLDAVDSYFQYVLGRMPAINPDRQVIAVMDAMDWPNKAVKLEAFYLLNLGEAPPITRSMWSAQTPTLIHKLQWVWLIAGSNLDAGKLGRSRGDRYRTNLTMRGELLQATYPWFTEKKTWSVQGNTPAGLALVGTSLAPSEFIWWTQPTFLNRMDKASGVIYGAATVELTDMTQQINS